MVFARSRRRWRGWPAIRRVAYPWQSWVVSCPFTHGIEDPNLGPVGRALLTKAVVHGMVLIRVVCCLVGEDDNERAIVVSLDHWPVGGSGYSDPAVARCIDGLQRFEPGLEPLPLHAGEIFTQIEVY